MSTDIRHIEASFLETLGFDRLKATSGIVVSTLGVSTDAASSYGCDKLDRSS